MLIKNLFKQPIPRGIIYHELLYDIKNLFTVLFSNLNNQSKIEFFKDEFSKLTNSKYCITFAYARTGVYFALKSQNFEKGSEIIMPPISIKAMVDAVIDLGLKPVFVDIDIESYCFDLKLLEQSINEKTKGILITYLFGMVPNIDQILKISKKNKLFVIEDFSQCLNGEYKNKKLGTFGDIGIYSSSTTKTLDTYGGGLCITDNKDLFLKMSEFEKNLLPAKKLRILKIIFLDLIRNFATSFFIFRFVTYKFILLFEKFLQKNLTKYVGERGMDPIQILPNFWFERYTSFQAMCGSKLLQKVTSIDTIRISNVKKIYDSNPSIFSNSCFLEDRRNVFWQFIYLNENIPEARIKFLNEKIDTATSSLILLSNLEYVEKIHTPNAKKLLMNGLFIPSYHKIKDQNLNRIINLIEKE